MSNIKKNFLYSSFLTTANYLFPLITYPYVSRVLGVSSIGLVNFIDGIISYFVLFATMGLSVIGIREIASVKTDKQSLNTSFSSLITLSFIFTLLSLITLIILTEFVQELNDNKELVYIGCIKLVFNFFLVEWFYKGLEEFKYITIRGLIVRCLYVVSVFIFVKDRSDYQIYYLLSCVVVVLNALINILYSRRFISFSLKRTRIKSFIKPTLILGIYSILTSMYTTFNIIFLGFVSNDTEVGFYTTATKLYGIILSIFTAFTGVMLPRLSSLIHEGKLDEFKNKIYRSISILVSLSIPIILLSEILTQQIVYIISGSGYEGAVNPMRIVMPLILVIGYEQILIIQTLMPLKKDCIIMRNSIIGAVLGIILNFAIVPILFSTGSALVWVCCEVVILALAQYAVREIISIKKVMLKILKEISIYIPVAGIVFIIGTFINSIWASMIISVILVSVFFIINKVFFFKDNEIERLIFNVARKIYHR